MPSTERMLVGFIGLGRMGLQMAARLEASGTHLLGADPAEGARAAANACGVEIASLEAIGARCGIVITMLPDSDVVESVVDSLLPSIATHTLLIDMSSSDPNRTRALAARLASHSVDLVDAPVSGGVRAASDGTLTIMVGGGREGVGRATPLLTTMGRVVPVGAVGSGHAIKALNNLLSATHLWATSEAMLAGERFGLDPTVMLEVFNGSSAMSGSTTNKWPNFILSGRFDSGFAAALMVKDMRIALELIDSTGVPAALGHDALALWVDALDTLDPGADHTEIAAVLRQRIDQRP